MNFANPITPGDCMRRAAERLTTNANEMREKAGRLIYAALKLEDAASALSDEADFFDRYQPPPATTENQA